MKQRLMALLLCAVLLFCGCASKDALLPPGDVPASSTGSPDKKEDARRTIPYSDMKYQRPDVDAVVASIDELTDKLKNAPDFDTVLRLDDEMDVLSGDFYTQFVLAFLGEYHDVTDAFYEDEMRFLREAEVEVEQHINFFIQELTQGPYASQYQKKVGDHYFESLKMTVLFTNESVKEYQKERASLNQDYNKMISSLKVTDGKKEYTAMEIFELEKYELFIAMYQQYIEKYLDEYAQLYQRMVELDKTTAYELGFEDAATMYYLKYNRDYSPADAKALLAQVQKHLAPLSNMGSYNAGRVGYKAMMSAMPRALRALDTELADAWDYMMEFGVYDMEYSPKKRQGVAFTYYLPAYDAPFIFSNYGGDFSDTNTVVHEFGHFYDAWLHYDDNQVDNLDVAETYSQSLELLMINQHHMFTKNTDESGKQVVESLLTNSLVWQGVLEDFQLRVYEAESLNAETLGTLFAQSMKDYGTQYHADGEPVNDWFLYATLFDSPFYTISYVASGTVAMQIWEISRDDWNQAVEVYQTLINANQNQPYAQLLAEAGLKAPQDDGVVEEIADLCRAYLLNEQQERRARAA